MELALYIRIFSQLILDTKLMSMCASQQNSIQTQYLIA